MGDRLIMSGKERNRNVVLAQFKQGRMNLRQAAEQMEVSYRQAKRLWKRYKVAGAQGLIHASRGKASSHAYASDYKEQILKLYREKYMEFGPTLAAEVLSEEDNIEVNAETLRLWLKAAGLWTTHRHRKSYRKRRQRRERFGELLQIDGSDHPWFGDDYPRSCLLNMIDDATGTTLSRLDTGETTQVLLSVLKQWIKRYGIPCAVYVDLKNLYVSPKRLNSASEDSKVEDSWSVFEKVCERLGINIIKAYSPQAKGRVERNHGVYQDRLVKMLALKNIKTIEDANAYLAQGFIDKLNRKFAIAPSSCEDAHRSAETYGDLDQILCWEYTRQVKLDWTIQFKNQHYQLLKSTASQVRAKQNIVVRKHLDGRITLWKGEHQLAYELLTAPPKKVAPKVKPQGHDCQALSQHARRNKHKTPWGNFNPSWLKKSEKLLSST